MKDLVRLALALGTAVLIGGIGLSSYYAEKGRADIAVACFAGGGKSLTKGWFGNVYCNR